MDEVISLAFNPAAQFGFFVGASTASVGFVILMALADVFDRRADRRNGRVIAGALDQLEHFQRSGDAIFHGSLPAPARAANEATLDLRDAYVAPRSCRSELRRSPR